MCESLMSENENEMMIQSSEAFIKVSKGIQSLEIEIKQKEKMIPEYDNKPIWFVRSKYGGWFSIDYMGCLMSGRLMGADFNYEEWKNEIH